MTHCQQTHEQKIQSLQHSVLFLQSEHASSLALLHAEIESLQKKCSELTYRLTLSDHTSSSFQTGPAVKEALEVQLSALQKQNKSLLETIESRDKRIALLEGQIRSKDQKHQDDLKNVQRRIAELEHELDIKSNTIAYLTSSIQKNRLKKRSDEQPEVKKAVEEAGPIEPIAIRYSPTPPVSDPPRRREYNLRRSVPSPAASTAGLIQESSSHQLIASDYVLQNSLPKTNSTRFSSRYKQTITNPPRPNIGFSQTRREKELKMANASKPKPSDYEDFLRISQPDVMHKSSVEPLPPITTRSGRQLQDPVQGHRRSLRNRATANARGEVEMVIMDPNLPSPERKLRALKNSMK